MSVKRGLLNYNNGLITLPIDMSQSSVGARVGDEVTIVEAQSERIEYNTKDANQWTSEDPIMNPNVLRNDGLDVFFDPNLIE